MAYVRRYAGGFVDLPSTTTAIDSTFLNAVEAALLKLFDTDPIADGQVLQWINASSKYGPALLLNKNVDPAAAIAKSKLDLTGANGIVNADVAAAAAIARSKLDFGSGLVNADVAAAAAIAYSKLASIPAYGPYRKTSARTINGSVAETDLLNGEITIGAGAIGNSGVLRLTASGDWKQNSGGATDIPRLRLKLGGTVVIDANILGATVVSNSATRCAWKVVAEVHNLGAANSQWVFFDMKINYISSGTFGAVTFSTGTGVTQTVLNSGASSDTVTALGGNNTAIDTSTSKLLELTTTNASASGTYEVKLFAALVEIIG